jgi:hypothetical protein
MLWTNASSPHLTSLDSLRIFATETLGGLSCVAVTSLAVVLPGGPFAGTGERTTRGSSFGRNRLPGITTKANHPQGWDAKPWVPRGSPGCRMVLVHPESTSVPQTRREGASAAEWLRGWQTSPSRPARGVGTLPGEVILLSRSSVYIYEASHVYTMS